MNGGSACCTALTGRTQGGIGSATGKLLHTKHARVALLYAPFERDKVSSTISEVYGDGSDVKAYECDVTSPTSVEGAFAAIAKDDLAFPSILVNTAGYITLGPAESISPEETLKHYMINLFGPTLTSQAFARMYIAASKQSRLQGSSAGTPGGRIVNLASQAAHVALHHHAPYCASKAGLVGLTKCLASEFGPYGITANTISPGPVWTSLGKKAWADQKQREQYQANVPTGKFAEPEEVARIVDFLCRDESLNINGADFRLDGGYTVR